MYSRAEVETKINDIMVDLFEIDKNDISAEKSLYEDLGLDSIDAIDLISELQNIAGRRLDPESFKAVRTVDDVVNEALKILSEVKNESA